MTSKNMIEINPCTWGNGEKYPYDQQSSIIGYIEKKMKTYPTRVALIDDKQSFTYQEVYIASRRLSKQLYISGLKKSDNVVICMGSSNQLIILIFAILMNGASYTAVDKNCPKERLEYMVVNNKAKLLIVDGRPLTHLALDSVDTKLLFIENLKILEVSEKEDIPYDSAEGCDTAYVIYTSGSTGKPKGIRISHSSVNNHMLWMARQFKLGVEDRFLLKTALTFDASVWEIFLPFYIGATLVVAEEGSHANPNAMVNYIKQYNITVIQLVPVIFFQILSIKKIELLRCLKYIFVGGESLSRKTKQLFFDQKLSCTLVNLYGPAEATIDTTFHIVNNTEDDLQHNYIGKPIYNVSVCVMNERDEQCQINETGELYIAGSSLAQGYLDEGLTAKSFVQKQVNEELVRLYKTGDLVRWTNNSELEYVCRKDKQIKLNGVRIEIEEIKNIIQSYGGIFDCLLDCETHPLYQYKYLSCYLLPVADNQINIQHLKDYLASKLPSYMLPSRYFIVEELGLSLSGKLDLSKIKNNISVSNLAGTASSTNQVVGVEQQLLYMWSSILHIPLESIHNDADFFELGGDSISSFILLEGVSKTFSVKMDSTKIILFSNFSSQLAYIKCIMEEKPNDVDVDSIKITSLNSSCEEVIFLIHPIGGTLFWYLPVAKYLDGLVQILAIQDPDIFSDNLTLHSIDQMAEAYTSCILTYGLSQKINRFVVGGASFGGTIALEIAKKLLAKGCIVNTVMIFDGWAVYPKQLNDEQYFYDSMYRQQQEWLAKAAKINRSCFDLDRLLKVQMHRLEMLFNYELEATFIHLDIFKAEEIMPIFKTIDHPTNHWERWAKNYNLHIVPGNHETMFSQANAVVLASKIQEIALSCKNRTLNGSDYSTYKKLTKSE